MKRIVATLGVTAAMAVAPSVASAGTSPQLVKPAQAKPAVVEVKSVKLSPQRAARMHAAELTLQLAYDDRSGRTLYRLGNSGLWME
jgi:hypothetical protein